MDTLRTSDGGEAISNLDKANEYFSSVFTQEDLNNIPFFPDVFKGTPITDIPVSEDDIYNIYVPLSHLRSKKSQCIYITDSKC